MYFLRGIVSLSLLITSALAASSVASVSYDNTYDKKTNSLSIVACSNGENGLLTKGFSTFGDLPSFPHIGGAQAVEGWNSRNCGTCWALTYKGKTIKVLAIDHAGNGFNIAQKAMDELTNNQAVDLGRVNVNSVKVAASECGL